LNLETMGSSLDPFPTIQQLLTLAAVHFIVCLTLAALLHCTIVPPTKEIPFRFLKVFFMIRV